MQGTSAIPWENDALRDVQSRCTSGGRAADGGGSGSHRTGRKDKPQQNKSKKPKCAKFHRNPHSHLCQNRDPIANLGDCHGRPIRYETDFNTHFDPLIFIVPVGLDGVDIHRELPRRGLYAYDLRSY